MCKNYLLSAEMDQRASNSWIFSSRSVVLPSYSTDKDKVVIYDNELLC